MKRAFVVLSACWLVLACHLALAIPCVFAAEGVTVTAENDTAPASDISITAQQNPVQETLNVYRLPSVTVYGVSSVTEYDVPELPMTVPVTTRFGTQFNVITEEEIARQGSLDFYDALRNVPGVMFQKKNIIGGQTGSSLYIRGRGASHPSPDLNILFDDVPRSGVLYGQALADGIPVYALGGMEIYKYPQPSRFGSGYGMINFIPKYMTEEGTEVKIGAEAGSYGTIAEHISAGMKKGRFDVYAAQSHIRTDGHAAHSSADQTSFYLNTGIQLNNNWSVRLMTNYVDAKTYAPDNPLTGARAAPLRFDTETTLATLSLNNEYENASGYIKAYYNDTNFYLVGESSSGFINAATSKQSNDLYGLRARETFRLWEGSEIVTGFDFDKMDLENRQFNRGNNVLRVWDFPNVTVFSPYVAVSQTIGDDEGFHVVPSAGVRYYSNSEFKDKVAPQAGLVLGYKNTNLNFNYAKGVNYPSPVVLQNFLTNQPLPSGFDTGKIKPEVVDHYEIGLTHTWERVGSIGATAFYDDGKDRTRAYMFGAAPNESFFNSHTAKYKIKGLELSGSVTPTENLEFFAGATWLRAKATGDNGVTQKRMPYTPKFALQAGFKWRFHENFQLSGDYQYLHDVYASTSMRTTNPGNPSSDFGELTKVNKLPNAGIVNLRLDYFFKYEPLHIKEGKIFVAVDNVLGTKYAYAKEISGTRSANYYMPRRTFMAGFELTF
jgi:iron complex outermembrane receptor protein